MNITPTRFTLITHPEVRIDPAVPVPRWPLSERGRARMQAALAQPWVGELQAVYSSTEQKAVDGATILADHLGLRCQIVDALGENDRSATGFLAPPEFERTADAFFAHPSESVRGWETAQAAQARMVAAVATIAAREAGRTAVAIVAHGAVGTLLYCHLQGLPIARRWDQPPTGGGNWYHFQWAAPMRAFSHWQSIDPPATP